MDLRESMWDSVKVFSQSSVCTTCRETFLPQNFHGIWYTIDDDIITDLIVGLNNLERYAVG